MSKHEDCGRCGASLEWLAENGCPFGAKTIWCLLIVTQRRSDMDTYLAWLDKTPLDEIPSGEDVSDLGALGETRYTTFSREEIIRRVAFARGRGRSWHTIATYLGTTEEAARRLYGDQGQNSGEDRQKPPDSGELKQTPPFS